MELSLVDFIFAPYLIIAAACFGYAQENPPPWRKQLSAVVASLWGGVLVFGYFVMIWIFGFVMLILFGVIGFVLTGVGLTSEQTMGLVMHGVTISLKYGVIVVVEAFITGAVAKDRGWFSGESLNFLDPDTSNFVAVAKPICHILMILKYISQSFEEFARILYETHSVFNEFFQVIANDEAIRKKLKNDSSRYPLFEKIYNKTTADFEELCKEASKNLTKEFREHQFNPLPKL